MDARLSDLYDERLSEIRGIVWFPWVGCGYPVSPRRLLIVGESHYTRQADEALAAQEIERTRRNPRYTRECVVEGLLDWEWRVPTFVNLDKLLFGGDSSAAASFWTRSGYCNIVQRQLRMGLPGGGVERPSFIDYIEGWRGLFALIPILEPSAILMIGTEALNHLPSALEGTSVISDGVARRDRIGRTYARFTSLTINGRRTPIHAIQHCGKYFSHSAWRAYLSQSCPELSAMLP